MRHENNKVYILTDSCMWEKNNQEGTRFAHAIEVVDIETGQVRFIKSGSKIVFIEGEITDTHSQETYNQMSSNGEKKLSRRIGKDGSKRKVNKYTKDKTV